MSFEGSLEYRVPYAHTDAMKVVYYAHYLVYFEMARSEALRKLGYPYSQMEAEGFQLPIMEAHVQYLQPARYEDLLTLTCRFEPLGKVRVKAVCQVLRDGELLAEGYTIHACYSEKKQRPTKFPPAILAHLESATAAPDQDSDASP